MISTCNRRIDELWCDFLQLFVPKAQFRQLARNVVFDQNVAFAGQVFHDILALFALQVNSNALR